MICTYSACEAGYSAGLTPRPGSVQQWPPRPDLLAASTRMQNLDDGSQYAIVFSSSAHCLPDVTTASFFLFPARSHAARSFFAASMLVIFLFSLNS